jgi:hypothetical protein
MITIEQRIRHAEADLFGSMGAEVAESFLDLTSTGVRIRLLECGGGPPLVLLHGVSLSAAAWAPLFPALSGWRVLAVDLPGHGLSGPDRYASGRVRYRALALIDDIFDALGSTRRPSSATRWVACSRSGTRRPAPDGSPGWSRSENRRSRFRASAYACRCHC